MAREKIPLYDIDQSHGDVRTDSPESIRIERESLRISTEIAVTCRPYTSNVFLRTPDGTMRKLLNVSRAKELGWEAKVGLREGIERTYRWFLEHQGDFRK